MSAPRRCYAAPLNDCDGGPLTAEDYISKSIQKQFGPNFYVAGASWSKEPIRVGPGSLASRILCQRHNGELSQLDDTMSKFYRALRTIADGNHVVEQFDGESLERWALKVLVGLIASGTFFSDEGRETVVSDKWLRVLFGHEPVPEGCGFHYVGDPIAGLDAGLMSVACNRYPEGDSEAGSIFGITIQLPGFRYMTAPFLHTIPEAPRLIHRPDGFIFGEPERGRIGIRWNGIQGSARVLLLSAAPESCCSPQQTPRLNNECRPG